MDATRIISNREGKFIDMPMDFTNKDPGKSWEPGVEGKFILDNSGKLHSWTNMGMIHHDYAMKHNVNTDGAQYGYIEPGGMVHDPMGGLSPFQKQRIKAADPRLKDPVMDMDDMWDHFSKVAHDEVPGFQNGGHAYFDFDGNRQYSQPWQPGQSGKGYISPEEGVHMWHVPDGPWSEPHHAQVMRLRGHEWSPAMAPFQIHEDGAVTTLGKPLSEAARIQVNEHPHLNADYEEDDGFFAKVADDQNKVKVITYKYRGMGRHPKTQHGSSFPWVYLPETNTLHMGPADTYHHDLLQNSPELAKSFGSGGGIAVDKATNQLVGRMSAPPNKTMMFLNGGDPAIKQAIAERCGAQLEPKDHPDAINESSPEEEDEWSFS